MEIPKDKLSIQEAAVAAGLSAHTLRYYERIGLIHPIERKENRRSLYTADDIGWIDSLTRLRATGISIRDVQKYAKRQGHEVRSADGWADERDRYTAGKIALHGRRRGQRLDHIKEEHHEITSVWQYKHERL